MVKTTEARSKNGHYPKIKIKVHTRTGHKGPDGK
jgi:hypothetical protein